MREYKKGGYAIIDLASTTIYKDALNAVASNKPVVVYDLPNVYFADTIATKVVDDDIVVEITKGGKTITINDANAVSSVGDIQTHLYRHNIQIAQTQDEYGEGNYTDYVNIVILNNNATPLTDGDFIQFLIAYGDFYQCTGNGSNGESYSAIKLLSDDADMELVKGVSGENVSTKSLAWGDYMKYIGDKVTQVI